MKEKPLISFFLGKTVTVTVEKGLDAEGELLRFTFGSKNKSKPHRPNTLIVQNGSNKHIIRGNWLALKSVERIT